MRIPIKDSDQALRGYLEEYPDGKLIALDVNYRSKAVYDPGGDITLDQNGKFIAAGNVLPDLILGYFSSW